MAAVGEKQTAVDSMDAAAAKPSNSLVKRGGVSLLVAVALDRHQAGWVKLRASASCLPLPARYDLSRVSGPAPGA